MQDSTRPRDPNDPGRPKRTPDEQHLLDATVKLRGRPMTVQEENLVIDEAYLIGDL